MERGQVMLNLEVVLIIHYEAYSNNPFIKNKKQKTEIKINDCEVISSLELYIFSNISQKR